MINNEVKEVVNIKETILNVTIDIQLIILILLAI